MSQQSKQQVLPKGLEAFQKFFCLPRLATQADFDNCVILYYGPYHKEPREGEFYSIENWKETVKETWEGRGNWSLATIKTMLGMFKPAELYDRVKSWEHKHIPDHITLTHKTAYIQRAVFAIKARSFLETFDESYQQFSAVFLEAKKCNSSRSCEYYPKITQKPLKRKEHPTLPPYLEGYRDFYAIAGHLELINKQNSANFRYIQEVINHFKTQPLAVSPAENSSDTERKKKQIKAPAEPDGFANYQRIPWSKLPNYREFCTFAKLYNPSNHREDKPGNGDTILCFSNYTYTRLFKIVDYLDKYSYSQLKVAIIKWQNIPTDPIILQCCPVYQKRAKFAKEDAAEFLIKFGEDIKNRVWNNMQDDLDSTAEASINTKLGEHAQPKSSPLPTESIQKLQTRGFFPIHTKSSVTAQVSITRRPGMDGIQSEGSELSHPGELDPIHAGTSSNRKGTT